MNPRPLTDEAREARMHAIADEIMLTPIASAARRRELWAEFQALHFERSPQFVAAMEAARGLR